MGDTLKRQIWNSHLQVYFVAVTGICLFLRSIGKYLLPAALAVPLIAHSNVAPQSSHTAWQLFQTMVEKSGEHNYRGVFMFSRDKVMSSMSVSHRWKDGNIKERLVHLDGDMGEIIRDGSKVICILPGEPAASVYQSGVTGPFAKSKNKLQRLKESYFLVDMGKGRVAGINARKLSLQSKDEYRYSYLLWIDEESGFLLKYILTGEDGELERFQYSQLTLDAKISDEELLSKSQGKVKSHQLDMEGQAQPSTEPLGLDDLWKVSWLPPGFKESNQRRESGSKISKVFSDGLVSFSVFIVPVDQKTGMPEGGARVGATTAFSKKVEFEGSTFDVTIVGEVPPVSAMKVAEAVSVGEREK